MKIAVFHELPDGGARSATKKFSNILQSLGNIVDLYYVSEKEDNFKGFKLNKVYFYKFIPKGWKGKDWKAKIYEDTTELYKLYNLEKKIANEINSKQYDLTLINASKFIESPFILRFIKSFKVFYAHDPNYRAMYEDIFKPSKNIGFVKYNYEIINRFFRRKFDKENLRRADLVIANSLFAKQVIKKTYGLDSKVAYLGVDDSLFKMGNGDKEIDVLFVGDKSKIDGYDLLTESLSIIKPRINTLIVPGDSGWISDQKEMVRIYQNSKIVVCLAINEPFGLVPLEAMSCGVPVIAVNEGGYRETVVDKKTGFLINRNSHELAEKIKILLSDPELARQMGENGRKEVINKWTWEKRGNELEKILLSLT